MKNNTDNLAQDIRSSEVVFDLRNAKSLGRAKGYKKNGEHLSNSQRYKRFVAKCYKVFEARKVLKSRQINSRNLAKIKKMVHKIKTVYLQGK